MSNRDFFSTASAVGIGALVGGLLSIEIASRFALGNFLWLVVSLCSVLGGLVSYVIVEFKQFCSGISDAYKKTISWKPYTLYWKTLLILYAGVSLMVYTMALTMAGVIVNLDGRMTIDMVFVLEIPAVLAVLFGGFITFVLLSRREWMVGSRYRRHLFESQRQGYILLRYWNPVSAPFVVLFFLGKMVVLAARSSPKLIPHVVAVSKTLRAFLVLALKNVHSQKRAVAFIDATLGALIGYFLGSALLGAIVGAVVLYPLHRNFIAVRWLKVLPE
jgi:hypothetical protein